jgi:glycosyltransferase involved in cell wall biosynthesis
MMMHERESIATEPRVSIVIPAYNMERFIQETLYTVESQTYQNWELLVVDDCSQDRTAEIVQAFAAAHPDRRVRLLHHEQNKGLAGTRNTGVRHAHGEYIALLDADDLWSETFLETMLATLREQQADIAYCPVEMFADGAEQVSGLWGPTGEELATFPASLYRRNFLSSSAVLIRHSVFTQIGMFDERIRACEDYDFWLRAATAELHFIYVTDILGRYRQHPSSLKRNEKSLYETMAFVLHKYCSWSAVPTNVRRARLAHVNRRAGRLWWPYNRSKAASFLWRAWLMQPRSVFDDFQKGIRWIGRRLLRQRKRADG